MEQTTYVLEMHHITKEFPGVKALDDVTLKIEPGKVHALMGENGAGKSTLMKCLFGIYQADAGTVVYQGREVKFHSALDALRGGISMIHQELQPEPHLTVMENLWMGRLPKKGGFLVDYKKMYEDTVEVLERLKLNLDPRALVKTLSVSQIQCIEIAKAVSNNANVIIMDEPTSSLTETEVEYLFGIIEDLRKQGIAIIYISHKMDEILRISDMVSVMRDGVMIGTWDTAEMTVDKIISKMVGRELEEYFPPKTNQPGEVRLRVEDYTSIYSNSFQHVSFELRRGEILGVAGLVGAQRTELVEGIFGIRSCAAGRLYLDGEEVRVKCPMDAIRKGMALLTEDRKHSGIFPVLSVGENIYMRQYDKASDFGKINYKKCNQIAREGVEQLNVKTPGIRTPINNLSGGNQQKALLARWLLTDPDILILDEPTRGIDVGAKYEIYVIISKLAQEGKSIIMISSEMNELLGVADRIMVMCAGRKTGELGQKEFSEEAIMQLATQFA
ncbi:MAG: sugar ABC transporter ATP-binding protein [Lachnospiraceae bacterium]|jgi:methyl-galactoside transport system ATP-binding protein|nr:sugar ABC transporter ATP-binding protein [Lachnospiraceae bacterium]